MKIRLFALAAFAIVVFFGVRFFTGSLKSASAEAIVEVKVSELTVKDRAGEAAFNANCASCHGKNAAGQENKPPPHS